MIKITPKVIVWLLPIAYLLHLVDEYFSGEGFHNWFSGVFNVSLSLNDFILINSIGFTAIVVIAVLYKLNKVNDFIIAVLGTLFFINGIIHLIASLLTSTYSPGTITGILIYLPLGYLIIKKIFPFVPEKQRTSSIMTGLAIQIIVAVLALTI